MNELKIQYKYDITQPCDLEIVTSDGCRIAAHSRALASASYILENLVYSSCNTYRSGKKIIKISGVNSDAVFRFLQCIYSPRSSSESMEKYGVQLLLLAHKYRIPWLKKTCEKDIAKKLTAHSVVDVLHITRICNASRLKINCANFICRNLDSVQKSDSWRFVQKNDPRLEHEMLQFIQETNQRMKRWRKVKAEQEMYGQLSEAMDCLSHICTEGWCSHCVEFRTCESLYVLLRHFAVCKAKGSLKGSCSHCHRMRQLFRLHSSLCDRGEPCGVPLCTQFKSKEKMELKGDDTTWRLLVKKVNVARVMLSFTKRRRPKQLDVSFKEI